MFQSIKNTNIDLSKINPPEKTFLRKDGRISIRKTMDPSGFAWNQFFKPVEIKKGTLNNCAGSCFVNIGNTTVLCAIQAEITACKDEPKGHVFFTVDIPSLGASFMKFNEKNEKQEALKNIITEIFDKSLQKHKLFKKSDAETEDAQEDLSWVLYVDCMVLQDDGCLLDALVLSICGALSDVKLPSKVFRDEFKYVRCSAEKTPISLLTYFPIPTTFSLINHFDFLRFFPEIPQNSGKQENEKKESENEKKELENEETTHILIDPLKIEERMASTSFCIIYNSQNSQQLVQVMKISDTTDFNASATDLNLKDDELLFCLSVAKKRIQKIVKQLSE